MTIGEICELVYLKVNGNKPSTDSSILRVDIKAMIPVAVNYAMDFAYNENLKIEGDRDYPAEFYSEFSDIPINRTTNPPTITLEKATVALKGGADIRFVYDNCDNYYSPLSDTALPMMGYYKTLTKGMFWYRRSGDKLKLWGLNPVIQKINYQAITSIEDLSDDDVAPIQAGKENTVMEWLINWFTKRELYDNKIDSRDDANAIPYK